MCDERWLIQISYRFLLLSFLIKNIFSFDRTFNSKCDLPSNNRQHFPLNISFLCLRIYLFLNLKGERYEKIITAIEYDKWRSNG